MQKLQYQLFKDFNSLPSLPSSLQGRVVEWAAVRAAETLLI
jgi:hypothetical protein